MAQRKQQKQEKDVLQRLADSGEEALQKFIEELPGVFNWALEGLITDDPVLHLLAASQFSVLLPP